MTATKVLVRLPSAGGAPLPSPELALDGDPTGGESPVLSPWWVETLACDAAHAPRLLTALPADDLPPDITLGDDLRFWIVAARFALELLCQQRFVPTLHKEGNTYIGHWRPLFAGADSGETDRQRWDGLLAVMPPACRALAWHAAAPEPRPRQLLQDFIATAVDALARQCRPFAAPRSPRRHSPVDAWLQALRGSPILEADPDQMAAFYRQYQAWAEPADAVPAGTDSFRVCFRLDPPPADSGAAAGQGWMLHYLLQATDDPSLLVPAAEIWRQRGATGRFLNRKFDNPQERLLAGLGRASRLFPPIDTSLHAARPEECHLTVAEAHDFVREKALLLRSSSFGVLVPDLQAQLGVRVKLGGKSAGRATGPGMLSWQSLVDYDWQLMLGDQPLSREEFETLARLKQPLVQVRGRWIELRPEQLEQALAFFHRQGTAGQMSLQAAIKLALAPDGDHGLPVKEVVAEGWIDELLLELRDGGRRETVSEPPGFVGQLRAYQKVGASWLGSLRRYGLGACLADDMGLGKTIQIIALLLHRRVAGSGEAPALIVCPTSVVGNWRHELARFAPSLRVLVHHGAGRNKEEFAAAAAQHDVVISTYALLHRDEAELTGIEWSAAILDEAQNIKNAATKAAQSARRLAARWRVALTGTPVENHLGDLWSIFHFLNPGYLGSSDEFRKRLANPIERAHDAAATERLKTLVAPFILRRLKSDRSIIADLPEKNEMKVFCNLTKEQATLYEAIVQDSLRQIEEAEGIQRRGMVLALLAKLKQLCDHPALFLHDGSDLAGRSGKLARLSEMLEEVAAVGDRALLFTQYAQMGKLLKAYLEAKFGREVLFLHGGTPAAQRDRMVARFQGEGRAPHLFILSLKAGGTGLNLTSANHVFHFDRWWNPAVENQATDRAFRIGQRRDVQVHKFVCVGTFEESIDQLIERKMELAAAIVGTSEAWITEMNTAALRDLFRLRDDAVGEE